MNTFNTFHQNNNKYNLSNNTKIMQKKSINQDLLLNLIRKQKNDKKDKEQMMEQEQSQNMSEQKVQQVSEGQKQISQSDQQNSDKDGDISMNSQDIKQAQKFFSNVIPIQKQKSRKKKHRVPIKDSSEQQAHQNNNKITQKIKSILKTYKYEPNSNKDKKKKSIKFSEKDNKQYILHNEGRRWDQKLPNPKKGKFQPQQKKMLFQSLFQCLKQDNITLQDIIIRLSKDQNEKLPRDLHFWVKVCSVLANRLLVSSYKFLKRQLCTKNKNGPWSQQQIDQLIDLVNKNGMKWSKISKQMNRTAENIKDKYRMILNQQSEHYQKQMWKLQQIVQLLRVLEKQTKQNLLQDKIQQQLQNAQEHNKKQSEQLTRRKYNSKNFVFHNNIIIRRYLTDNFMSLKLNKIKWHKVSRKIQNRTQYDCKNKILQLLMISVKSFGSKEIIQKEIIDFIVNSKPKSQADIDWSKMKSSQNNSIEQIRNRYLIFKRNIQGRGQKSFKDLIEAMKERVYSEKKQ